MQVFRTLTAAALLAVAGAGASVACGMGSFVDTDPSAVYAVEITGVQGVQVNGDSITLTVSFNVPTGGSTDPELVPVTYFVQPWDGVYDLYAVAMPPEGVGTDALTPMTATIEVPVVEGLHGWRILADSGCVTLMLDGAAMPEGASDGCTVQTLTIS